MWSVSMALVGRTLLSATSQSKTSIQEALEMKHQPMYFKLSLPSESEMRMVRWAFGTPEHFLIHVQGAIHAITEMELDTKFQEAAKAVESAILEIDLT